MNAFFSDIQEFICALSLRQRIAVAGLFLLAFGLRLYPGADNYLWTYDQARDAYTIRSIIEDRNLMLVGPQTEFFGLRHGVLTYYLLAPAYFFSQGDPNLPALTLIIWNLTALIPLTLLAYSWRRNVTDALMVLSLAAISYQLIEYSRWISNLSFSVAPLAWFYYFFWRVIDRRKLAIAAGLSLGLAIQGEFFLIYLIPLSLLYFYFVKTPVRVAAKFGLGLIIGTVTYLLAELKFGFLGTKTFFTEFLGDHAGESVAPSFGLTKYLDHIGVTTQQLVGGLTPTMGLFFFIFLVLSLLISYKRGHRQPWLMYLLAITFSHSLLFSFRFVDAVFVNIPVLFPIILLAGMAVSAWFVRYRLFTLGMMMAVVLTLFFQLQYAKVSRKPFAGMQLVQSGITFSEKLELIETAYMLAGDDEPFTLSVLGSPYGVDTVWASLFEQYHARTGAPLPILTGFWADGYEGSTVLAKTDQRTDRHITIIESNYDVLIDEHTIAAFLANEEKTSRLLEEREIAGFRLQLREYLR
ncbi:MAG: hypothetical protein O2840_03540 [bacterium]|nr:hypothetical protein [bacterium]